MLDGSVIDWINDQGKAPMLVKRIWVSAVIVREYPENDVSP